MASPTRGWVLSHQSLIRQCPALWRRFSPWRGLPLRWLQLVSSWEKTAGHNLPSCFLFYSYLFSFLSWFGGFFMLIFVFVPVSVIYVVSPHRSLLSWQPKAISSHREHVIISAIFAGNSVLHTCQCQALSACLWYTGEVRLSCSFCLHHLPSSRSIKEPS